MSQYRLLHSQQPVLLKLKKLAKCRIRKEEEGKEGKGEGRGREGKKEREDKYQH
jgi:hypothetical protein